jgi:hypothetical protein
MGYLALPWAIAEIKVIEKMRQKFVKKDLNCTLLN